MTLTVTVGGASSNSYATLTEALSYINSHYLNKTVTDKWSVSADSQKEAAMVKAAQLLDRNVKWQGDIATEVQALSWPRVYAYDRNGRAILSTIIPNFLKEFQIETALWLMEQSGVVPQVGSGEFDSITVGQLEINFNEAGAGRRSLLSEEVIASLSPMGTYAAQTSGGVRNIRLERS